MANEKTPVVWDDATKKHRPLGTGEKMGGLDASSILSSDSGNLIQTGSDGLAYLSGGSIADPRADNLLEESANGKLQVTADRIVEWLGLNPSDAEKIAEALAAKMSAELADGQTIVASGGKLHSDPTNATVAQKKKINQALADADSGLVVDNSTGKLKVDFSNMPTDKFEALLAGLKMQVPLESNLSLYVNNQSQNAGDDIVDGRGTAAKPFRTVQACVSWAASYYALGSYSITIYVHPGSPYDGQVTLPAFSATTGVFRIRTDDPNGARPVLRISGGAETNINAVGGNWYLHDLNLVNNPSDPGDGRPHYPYCLRAYNGARVGILGCTFEMSYYGAASTNIRPSVIVAESGGFVDFRPAERGTEIKYHKGDAYSLTVLAAGVDSSVGFYGTWDSLETAIACQGDATFFATAGTGSYMQPVGSGSSRMHFVAASGQTCTGYRYSITEGSGIFAPSGGFPGSDDTGNVVESSTYCWYKEAGA